MDLGQGRERWSMEEAFIHNRISWLGVTQGILIAALGLALSKESPPASLHKLASMIPWIGLVFGALVLLGVAGAVLAMRSLRQRYNMKQAFVSPLTTYLGWMCSLGIPVVFCVFWILILVVGP